MDADFITDRSWGRVNHPTEVVAIGQKVNVIILDVNRGKERVSLGMKQLLSNPWDEIDARFPIGMKIKGKVRNLTAYGAFVEMEEGIDGMVHVSDLSWTRKVNHPSEMLKKGDEVEARVITVDKVERRIGLSVKAANYSEEDLRKETAAFEALRPSTDMVGLEEAFKFAAEEWRPGQK